jgi:Methyltransferase domain
VTRARSVARSLRSQTSHRDQQGILETTGRALRRYASCRHPPSGHYGSVGRNADHWDGIYSTGTSTRRSWYEREPTQSLRLIEMTTADRSATIIDLGAGTSRLVDRLLDTGFTDVTVLDVSGHALDEVGLRLGPRAGSVSFIRQDVLSWQPDRQYDVWHDRAVFHFLCDQVQRSLYVSVAAEGVRTGGAVIVATFAEDGSTQCSGLPVARYSADELAAAFAEGFEPVHSERELHETPAGALQPFTWMILRRM